jgi:hypothetical protein
MRGDECVVTSIIPSKRMEGIENRNVRAKGCNLNFFNTRCRIHCGTVVSMRTMATLRGNSTSRKGLGPGGLRMISTPKKMHQNAMLQKTRVDVVGFCNGFSWFTFFVFQK